MPKDRRPSAMKTVAAIRKIRHADATETPRHPGGIEFICPATDARRHSGRRIGPCSATMLEPGDKVVLEHCMGFDSQRNPVWMVRTGGIEQTIDKHSVLVRFDEGDYQVLPSVAEAARFPSQNVRLAA